jgi:hypothetical protein
MSSNILFRKYKRYLKFAVPIIALIVLIVTVQAITQLHVPQTVIPAQTATTNSSCYGNLALASPPTPGSGTLRYDCGGPLHDAAFTVTSTGTDTPHFDKPNGLTSVGYVSNSADSCNGFTQLTNGQQVILANTGPFDICATYNCPNGCTVAAWSFTWSS